jgi:hypothetical protein
MALGEGDLLVWDPVALDLYFRSPLGGVARDLARRAVAVESAAKVNASGRPGPRVITGRLRSSISWRLGEDVVSIYADVGSNVYYARYVEEGHPTVAWGHATGRNTPAYPFLKPALAAAAL